tara:strand:+ start:3586 stop:5256 length:1671 start_codon:yes stop_codon:yes gene_type:complete
MTGYVRIASIVTFALSTMACSPASIHSTEQEQVDALDAISVAGLQAHVRYLADDANEGREAGTPGYDRAAAYVAEQLETMGAQPGGSDGWLQPVTLQSFTLAEGGAAFTVYRGNEGETFTYRDDFSMSADAIRVAAAVRADVVYVGYGVHAPEFGYSDYEGVDVDGKIVAVFPGAPDSIEGAEGAYYASSTTKSLEAVARGAVGSITLRSHKAEERKKWEDIKPRFGSRPRLTWTSRDGRAARYYPELRGNAYLSIDAATRLFQGAPLSFEEAHAAMLANEVRSVPLGVSVSLSTRSEHSTVVSANVIGVVRGTDPTLADEFVVYSAHLDHLGIRDTGDDAGADKDRTHNGLYDNAMGVALMLETARAMAAAPPKRSVLFVALTAEESGLLGSDYFVNNPTVPLESLVANINLDMPLFLYPLADLVAFGAEHSSLRRIAEAGAAAEGFVLAPDPIPKERLFVRSDQYSFVKKGIPAIYLVTGFNSTDAEIDGEALFRDHVENHYHEPSDDMTRPVDWDSALRFARANARMGQAIANEAERPTWNEGDFFGQRFAGQ